MKIRTIVLVATLTAALTGQIFGADNDDLGDPTKPPALSCADLCQYLDTGDFTAAINIFKHLAKTHYKRYKDSKDPIEMDSLILAGELYLKAGVLGDGQDAQLNSNIQVIKRDFVVFKNTPEFRDNYYARAVAAVCEFFSKSAPDDLNKRTAYQIFTEGTDQTPAGLKRRLDNLANKIEELAKAKENRVKKREESNPLIEDLLSYSNSP